MKTVCVVLLLVAASGVVAGKWSPPQFCKDRDCPRFQEVDKADGYETRKYESALWAWVETDEDLDLDGAIMEAHAELFHYFNGSNDQGKQIPMAVPMAHNISMQRCREDDGLSTFWAPRIFRRREKKVKIVVKLYLPYSYQDGEEQPPKPKSKHVHVEKFPEWTAHVRGFEGWPTARKFKETVEDLMEYLEDDKQDYSDDYAVFSIYDPPTELEDRYNEVLISAEESDKRARLPSRGWLLA